MNTAELHRRQYLDALGITRWEPRHAPVSTRPEIPKPATESCGVLSKIPTEPILSGRPDDAADNSRDWTELEAEVRACTKCPLHTTRTQTVFGVGHRQAKWMFIGEAPGADEDRQGEPFVGKAGQLLNAILFAMGLKREEVYIANVLKCRPPGNRDPQPEEVAQCEPYLLRQIELIRPRLIVALGRHAAHSLLKTEVPLGKLRGQKLSYHGTPLFVTYHPAYLLRNPADKRKVWDDLCRARAAMMNMEKCDRDVASTDLRMEKS
ncbi:MAG: uracil-DNA glycosylase [Gammaproteobacteria bacterium]|nr:uracil-DNA glycosylase [Gammaproteobacteria bacterium]